MKKVIALFTLIILTAFFLPGCQKNEAPVINSITADQDTVRAGGVVTITCDAVDPEEETLVYEWSSDNGTFTDADTNPVLWTSPSEAGDYSVICKVSDTEGNEVEDSIVIHVISNSAPVIDSIVFDSLEVAGFSTTIVCYATDPDLDEPLTYYWESLDGGSFSGDTDTMAVTWEAPGATQTCRILCSVSDGIYTVADTITIEVQNYTPFALGNKRVFEGELNGDSITLETEVISRTELGDGRIEWRLERKFNMPDTVVYDSTISYITSGDSIFLRDSKKDEEYLIFLLPLWVGKTWDTGSDGTGTITEEGTCDVTAGSFSNCLHAVIDVNETHREHWLAPDIGVVITKIETSEKTLNLELVSYDFGP